LVVFLTDRSLSPDDLDSARDVYVRDIATRTTTLVDRADGAAGAKANGIAAADPTISQDGRYAGFASMATNIHPDDTDSLWDSFVRDLEAHTTTLVSRDSGATGAKADGSADAPTFAAGGDFLAFNTNARNFDRADTDDNEDAYVRDLQTLETSLESRATPGFVRPVRPKGATPFRVSLVPAAQPCTAPNTTHGAPLSFAACTPVVSASPNLEVSDGEFFARSTGFLLLNAFQGNPSTPADEAGVAITLRITNVKRTSDMSDYPGELQARISLRRTDKFNGPSGNEDLTSEDFDFPVTIPCAANSDPILGSECSITTFFDALINGSAPEGKRTVYELGQTRVYDGGSDGDGDTTGDNSLFAVQGVFVP
jgi:hypothetical protein